MLQTIKDIFASNSIEINKEGERAKLHSHTSLEQGIFIQKIFDQVKPEKTLEVGMAYGISTLFILEKHRQKASSDKSHTVIEPFPWGTAASYNIAKEGLSEYIEIKNDLSDMVIPRLYYNRQNIQLAYVDTTKLFDVVMQDFYFIDKILDVGGAIIIDDCDTGGLNHLARFVNTLPHYKILDKIGKVKKGFKLRLAESFISMIISMIPFKEKVFPNFSLKTDTQLGLDYRCIAFQKIGLDQRKWDWYSKL